MVNTGFADDQRYSIRKQRNQRQLQGVCPTRGLSQAAGKMGLSSAEVGKGGGGVGRTLVMPDRLRWEWPKRPTSSTLLLYRRGHEMSAEKGEGLI